mmetsp:Transcript_12648/g.40319  ORF Transcript_12648/g.40319 Transcript_12648/m.40319 type:complete len:92 (+) Transcript_12648:1127-1402(+)
MPGIRPCPTRRAEYTARHRPPALTSLCPLTRLSFLLEAVLSYRRARPLLFGWLERVQVRIGSYGPDGAARKRDREEFEGDFGVYGEGFERI